MEAQKPTADQNGEKVFTAAQERVLSEMVSRIEGRISDLQHGMATDSSIVKLSTDIGWMRLIGAICGVGLIGFLGWFYISTIDGFDGATQKSEILGTSLGDKIAVIEKDLSQTFRVELGNIRTDFISVASSKDTQYTDTLATFDRRIDRLENTLTHLSTRMEGATAALSRIEAKLDSREGALGQRGVHPRFRTFELPQNDEVENLVKKSKPPSLDRLPKKNSRGHQPNYSAEDILAHFSTDQVAKEECPAGAICLPKKRSRGVCIGSASKCGKITAVPRPGPGGFDLLLTFELGSDRLSRKAIQNLREFAKAMSHDALKNKGIMIAGHTGASGSDVYNMALSRRRAQAAASFLQSLGIPSERIAAEGRGESEPRVADDPFSRINNRVEVSIWQDYVPVRPMVNLENCGAVTWHHCRPH